MNIEDYLSLPLWKKKYEEEIKWARSRGKEEKLDVIISLNLMGRRLIEANDKEKKLEALKKRSIINKERLKKFINAQLEK
ncbi:MAG: hypothetical protein AB1595_01655 [bacterium]